MSIPRDASPAPALRRLADDLAAAARGLSRRPGFTTIAVFTLALGIAAACSLFSLVAGTLLRSPALPQAERLVVLHSPGGRDAGLGQPTVADLRARVPAFAAVGLIWDGYAFDALFAEQPFRLNGALVDKGWFDAMRATPILGRSFSAAENGPGAPRVVVLAESLWRERYAADAQILGRTLEFNGLPFEVIGVMPDSVDLRRSGIQLWAPAALGGPWVYTARGSGVFDVVARLADDADLALANQQLAAAMDALAAEHPRSLAGRQLVASRAQDWHNARAGRLLWTLQAATFVLLAVAAVNLAALLLVRALGRRDEIGLRDALGAGRARLWRLLLAEGALLGLAGSVLGVALAALAVNALPAWTGTALPLDLQPVLDRRLVALALLLAVASGMLAAVLPALLVLRPWQAGGSRHGAGRGARRALHGLLVAEVALACVLVVGAGLLLRSLQRLAEVPLGFDPQRVLSAELVLPDSRYGEVGAQSLAVERIVQSLQAIPGVEHAGFVVGPPLRPGCCMGHALVFEGGELDPADPPGARVRPIHGETFAALGMRLLQGRAPAANDDAGAPRVAWVNRRFAERHFPDGDVIGRRLAFRPGDVTPREQGPQWMTIAGVVDDVRSDLRGGDAEALYFPYLQRDQEWVRFGTLLVKVQGEPMGYAAAMQQAVATVDPRLPLQGIAALPAQAAAAAAGERFAATLATGFAVVAWLLALQGVAAVLAFGVAQRRRELGIRAALGASADSLCREVYRRGLATAAIGLLLGLALALPTARLLQALMFETSAHDPASLAGGAVAVLLGAALAAWWPARQAARTAPMEALRQE